MIRGLVSYLLFAAILFGAAGTFDWPRGWAFLGLVTAVSVVISVWLWRFDKDLFAERAASPFKGQSPRDLVIVIALVALTIGWLALAPLDARRFGWSHPPASLAWPGAALIVATFVGYAWVLRANRFATTQIKIQPERGQSVIATGPYAVVRHPMYASALLFFIGAPLMLGSWWALALVPPLVAVLGARAASEEALLRESLPGYEDYARRVRWRLVPGVW